ncbi:hypothetical protein NNA36_12130 [Shimia sp. CNT1-13L.2]|uniref:hypothetical protein n=1 Tax=Shimia sp. CNT1-13L.2 TaxID=2959663 RepID=UPI0020CCC11A|nr:hypothetical protein [Shimia sp. CNT1-13L.2]MCP9482709.1 hypothetical protein [Shimia sp. CNT1-13L.2]
MGEVIYILGCMLLAPLWWCPVIVSFLRNKGRITQNPYALWFLLAQCTAFLGATTWFLYTPFSTGILLFPPSTLFVIGVLFDTTRVFPALIWTFLLSFGAIVLGAAFLTRKALGWKLGIFWPLIAIAAFYSALWVADQTLNRHIETKAVELQAERLVRKNVFEILSGYGKEFGQPPHAIAMIDGCYVHFSFQKNRFEPFYGLPNPRDCVPAKPE